MNIEASQLAKELGVSVSDLLFKADAIIDQTLARDGMDAIRGLSTGTRFVTGGSIAVITPKLADALRAELAKP